MMQNGQTEQGGPSGAHTILSEQEILKGSERENAAQIRQRPERADTSQIKEIEDLSLNAWPSHQIQIYDGWLLRFSYFYTHRTNSVEQIGRSELPPDEKILYCENEYRRWGTPAIFKITPLLPASFENLLIERGYHTEHCTDVMVKELSGKPQGLPAQGDAKIQTPPGPAGHAHAPDPEEEVPPVQVSRFISDAWIEGLFTLKHTTNVMHRQVVPSMYRAIPRETICVWAVEGGRIAATGLGILDRGYVGVYAIHVRPDCRRKHLGSRIVRRILQEAEQSGAEQAYLQVVSGNEPAVRLYSSLGFRRLYAYSFRVRQV